MTRRRISAIAVAAGMMLAALAPAPMALGQADLPVEIVRAGTLTSEQVEQIRRFTEDAVKMLASPDPREVKRGRDRLLAPLRGRDISVRFRQEYSNQIVPGLRQLPVKENELCAVNVLRIAGELATSDSSALLEQSLADERVAVRFAAVTGMGRTFDAVNANSPAMPRDGGQRLVTRLGERIEKEPAAVVVDAAVRALMAAMNVTRSGFDVRQQAISALALSMGNRIKQAGSQPHDPALMEPALRTGIAIRDALTVNNPGLAVDAAGARAAAEYNGHLVAYLLRRLKADFPQGQPSLRDEPAQLLSVAETAIPLAGQRLGNARVTVPAGMVADFKKADAAGDRDFFRKAMEVIALLQREPFNFPPGHFLAEDGGDGRAQGGGR
jgi:hypothetical protein